MSLPGGTSRPRAASVEARLARLGFVDPIRARRMLDDPAMTALVGVADDRDATSIALVEAMGRTSDPDQAVLGLLRVSEAVAGGALRDDPEHGTAALVRAVREDDVARLRLTAVLGGSSALADYLVSHPRAWRAVATAQRRTGDELRDRLVSA
ncbi:MAG: bifunctional glutamine-synthetase adenylyltransferase/deadenyltransferase, partial [Candidatus Lutibacillus vidarii]